jgi:ribonucleoside-triphosphate reductase (formate)
MNSIKIIKRDGREKDYDRRKIEVAVEYAKEEVGVVNELLSMEVASLVTEYLEDNEITCIDIEDVQDIVIEILKQENIEVATAYQRYRKERMLHREASFSLNGSILGLVNQTNEEVMTENSNKQATLASTQRDLIAGEVSKYIAKTQLIPPHLVRAMDEGIIKFHDLDYYLQPITNCELVNLKDMFENGTVINKKMIETPKSLRTASTLATQISAQVSSFTYGGQTMSVSHLAPYVRVSKDKYIIQIEEENVQYNLKLNEEQIELMAQDRLQEEIKDAVQTFNYQLSTLNSTNGQSPFLSLAMYISEDKEYEKETAMLIEEFLRQRIKGMKNEYGVVATQTFPKLLYFLDINNVGKDSEYYYLTKLAIEATAKRMNPDYISVKKMKEIIGFAIPCMGCRSFLSPWMNENGEYQFYGRGNLGVTTLNLVDIALTSEKDIDKFWIIFKERLELVKESLMLRFDKLKGVKASVAPIIWQHGAIARLQPDDEVLSVIDKGRFTLSLGYAGIYETVKYMTGESHTSEKGFKLAEEILILMRDTADRWKEETGLGFGIYGSPQESTGGWFADKLKAKFGEIDGITNKGWITNSYHVDIQEKINAFDKLEIESELSKYSTGGNVSYIESYNMEKNLEALEQIVNFIYETNIYAEVNSESDVCGICKYTGAMDNDDETLDWVCPQCGNRDQNKLSVVRRTCGYLGETVWSRGRKLDILNRVKHI